jgi:peptide/nickel transport system permease protein
VEIETKINSTQFSESPVRVSEARHIMRVLLSRKIVIFGLCIILITAIVAIFAPWLAPYDPNKMDLKSALMGPTGEHLLGTDALGRDMLSRLIYGSRTAMLVGIASIAAAATIGMTMGLLAGYFGGIINMIIMRTTDALMSFPMILLALTVAAILGGGLRNIIIAIGASLVAVYTRLMCAQVLSVKENDYILAGRSIGISNPRILLVHVLPNCFPPLIVMITLMMGSAILSEAGLSFLGVGVEPPMAAWGSMVNDGYRYLLSNPLLSFVPGFAIMLVVFSFNMVGDGLRDALDPKLRGLI